ncbi:MAG: MoxR family ATPase [Bacillaceae bacterium]|uniref:ATPase ravA n=1 Tax=Exiguobacterium aurantiacum TaxID=33987 RepID=A0A377HH53_9BACL|nr:MoxR family ATPase [Exiguobacterium aurantiacum]MEB1809679.1 MoxR family ATPase [Bacillaceae bacterium]STO53269.1 ATPase ravA [Exiguobacterium aurantiacum]
MSIKKVLDQLNQVYLGKSEITRLCCTALLANGHILLEDVPGTGKTLLAKSIARSFEADFTRIQFTADLLPTDVLGADFFNVQTQTFENKTGPIFTNILLIDEINRAVPRTQSALLEAMEERQVSIGGVTYRLPEPFFVIATQNPIESAGTFALPDAQLDRFLMSLQVGYPEISDERNLILQTIMKTRHELHSIMSNDEFLSAQRDVENVRVHEDVVTYLLEIIQATRSHPLVEVGASPRATLALVKASQAYAFINERHFVAPEDVKSVALHVLSHRLTLTLEGDVKSTKQDILADILERIEVPVEKV